MCDLRSLLVYYSSTSSRNYIDLNGIHFKKPDTIHTGNRSLFWAGRCSENDSERSSINRSSYNISYGIIIRVPLPVATVLKKTTEIKPMYRYALLVF